MVMKRLLALPYEIWRDIKDYEGLYQVSNLGRIKRICDSITIGMYGQIIVRHRNNIIKGFKGKRQNDYWRVYLYKNGSRKKHLVHVLVYETFFGDIPEGMQVNHKDENKDNNSAFNLNLLTPKENCNWGTRNERITKTKIKKRHPVFGYRLNYQMFSYILTKFIF